MDGRSSSPKKNRFEIRQVAKCIFYGGGLDREVEPFYLKWKFFFTLFDRIISHKSADYISPPFNDDWVNQPYKTMLVLDYMRELWIEKLIEEQSKK